MFHTIAVVGASLGCGSPEHATGTSSSDAGSAPDDRAISDAAVAPSGICDCPRPGEFRCDACASGQTPIEGRCPADDGADCRCDSTVAIAAPTDCAHSEQFVCAESPDAGAPTSAAEYAGASSWFAFADCTCDTTRPVMASQCTCEQCALRCAPWSSCAPVDAGQDAASGPTFGPVSPTYQWGCACENLPPPVTIAPL